MTDSDLARLILTVSAGADLDRWTLIPDGASARLIPGERRHAPNGCGVVVCCPDGAGRFVLLARFVRHGGHPPDHQPATFIHNHGGQIRGYEYATEAQARADIIITCGMNPTRWSRHHRARRFWWHDPVGFLLPPSFRGCEWSVLHPGAELALLPHLRPVHTFDPAVLALILPTLPSGPALDAAALVMAWNQREHFRWGDQNPVAWDAFQGHAAPSAAACRATLDHLVAAAVRHLAETGEDPAERVLRHLAPLVGDPLAELISSMVPWPHHNLPARVARHVPQAVAPASALDVRRFALEVAAFDLTHGLEALRRPLAAFARAATDPARYAAAAALQDTLQREADAGRLTPDGLQVLFDTWAFGVSCPRIVVTATPGRAA